MCPYKNNKKETYATTRSEVFSKLHTSKNCREKDDDRILYFSELANITTIYFEFNGECCVVIGVVRTYGLVTLQLVGAVDSKNG